MDGEQRVRSRKGVRLRSSIFIGWRWEIRLGRGLLECISSFGGCNGTLHYKKRVSLKTSRNKVGLLEEPLYGDLHGDVLCQDENTESIH